MLTGGGGGKTGNPGSLGKIASRENFIEKFLSVLRKPALSLAFLAAFSLACTALGQGPDPLNLGEVDGVTALGATHKAAVYVEAPAQYQYSKAGVWVNFDPAELVTGNLSLAGANAVTIDDSQIAAIMVRNSDTTFSFPYSNINIEGKDGIADGELIGFRYLHTIGNAAAGRDFTGNIEGGNIIVKVVDDKGSAFGVLFNSGSNKGFLDSTKADLSGATVKFGDITATTAGVTNWWEGAAGFAAGALKTNAGVGSEVTLNSVTVSGSAGGYGTGVELHGNIEAGSKLTVTNAITVTESGMGGTGLLVGLYDGADFTFFDIEGDVEIGSIDIDVDSAKESVGVRAGEVSGNVKVNGLTKVVNEGGAATGFAFKGGITNGGVVDVKNINVEAKDNAIGLWTGKKVEQDATVQTGNITVTSSDKGATGLYIDGDFEGTMKVGNINVTGGEDGTTSGITVMGSFDAQETIIGRIVASGESNVNNVYGIAVEGNDSNFTITNNITATNTGNGDAYGVQITGSNSNVNVKGNVNVTGSTFGFNFEGNDSMMTLDGAKLVASGVRSTGDLTVAGEGYANLGAVNAVGKKLTIGNGVDKTEVAIDLADMRTSFANNSVLEDNAILYGYGDSDDLNREFEFAKFDGEFFNKAQFTNWAQDGNRIINKGTYKKAQMNDGLMAALSMHKRYTAWTAVHDRMISGSGYRQSGYLGQCAPVCRETWVNYIGRSDAYRSSYNNQNWKTSMDGIQVGSDIFKTRNAQFGLLFGYESGKSTNAADRVNADDIYFGAYTAYVLRSGADVRAIFAYGWQDYDMSRYFNNNRYTSSFKGNTTETNLEFGRRFGNRCWSMRPVLAVDIMTNNLKDSREAGAGPDAVVYGKSDLTQVFLRTGTDLRYQANCFTFNSGVYYAYDLNDQSLSTTVSRRDRPLLTSTLVGTELGNSLLTFNVGGEYQFGRHMSVFGGWQGDYLTDSAADAMQSTAFVGTGLKW